jgi:hypothetical protein
MAGATGLEPATFGVTDRAEPGHQGATDKLQRDAQAIREAWVASGVVDRGRVQSSALITAVAHRAEWARRYDPIRLTIEHDRFCAEHIYERRAQHESIDVMEPDRLICDAVGDPARMARYTATTGELLRRLGLEHIVLIRGLPICEFSFGFTRVSATPIYHREFNGRSVPMPVRLNAFPELPNGNRQAVKQTAAVGRAFSPCCCRLGWCRQDRCQGDAV